jgi:hypothetical protein
MEAGSAIVQQPDAIRCLPACLIPIAAALHSLNGSRHGGSQLIDSFIHSFLNIAANAAVEMMNGDRNDTVPMLSR